MNYKKHYENLINRSKSRIFEGYSEKHHIIPKCMGGSNKSENLVILTPEEHYVAHQLLVKLFPDETCLVYAARMMSVNRSSNKIYGWIRRRYSKIQSKKMKGSISPTQGKPLTEEHKKKISKALKGRKAWNKGKQNPQAAVNGKKSADKLRVIATGRRKMTLPDGTWTWSYTNKQG